MSKKRHALGQHFLRDSSIISLIVDTALQEAHARDCTSLLEIGPGRGAITLPLAAGLAGTSIRHWTLSEADRLFAENWTRVPPVGIPADVEFKVAHGDFLELDDSAWMTTDRIAVASNLPYSAGTAITVRLARHPDKIKVMVLMFQAEVARRLRAEPSTKEWGSLSIWIQNRWDVKKLVQVPPRAFMPPPKVDSEVVVLTPRPVPRIAVTPEREAQWESLLKTAFAHRRKMLRSGIPPSGPWRNALERSGIDGTKRAEALDWAEWGRWFSALSS